MTVRNTIFQFGICLIKLFIACPSLQGQSLLSYVQPFAGTAPATTPAAKKHGEGTEQNANTIPAVSMPFAMTHFTPQTRLTETKCIPPYFFKDSLLYGFRGTHWLSGSCVQDYGSFTIMPITGKLRTSPADYATKFSHEDETTGPAYYRINLPQQHLVTEITATARCGIMQFTVEKDDSLYLLFTPNSDQSKGFIKVDKAKGEVSGYNPVHRIYQGWGESAGFNGYFFISIQKKPTITGTFSGSEIFQLQQLANKKDLGAFVGFRLKKGEQISIRIGTSFSSLEGARKNVDAEIPDDNFKLVLSKANATWQKALSQITVNTSIEKDKKIFYTAMYHAMLHPRLYSDADGTYPAFDGNRQLQKSVKGNYYDDFSMWDIYRAQLPLFEMLQPGLINQLVRSLIAKGQQGKWLPIFPCWNSYTAAMIGDHATAFIASAYAKGIRNYDVQEAYRLMRQNAFTIANNTDYKNGKGRRALRSYLENGFIPVEDSVPLAFHKKEQVSRTLEYAYDDYALSVVAKQLNADDYQQLHGRAFNYKKVFDTSVAMVRARHTDGSWFSPFQPDKREFYITEGTPRQYTFYVPHDVAGLSKLMGGEKALEKSLDSLFLKDEYWHGNEPGHQIPFLYNYTASPFKTQQKVRQVLAEEYSDGPGGLSGNDDAGQMSAWYVFASIGFYPVDPVSGEYLLCSPLFDKIIITLPANKKLEIVCAKQTPGALYISKVKLNGKQYLKNYIKHEDIMKGGKLEIYLEAKPSNWGTNINSRPFSLSDK